MIRVPLSLPVQRLKAPLRRGLKHLPADVIHVGEADQRLKAPLRRGLKPKPLLAFGPL